MSATTGEEKGMLPGCKWHMVAARPGEIADGKTRKIADRKPGEIKDRRPEAIANSALGFSRPFDLKPSTMASAIQY